jgi:hypothetical protein
LAYCVGFGIGRGPDEKKTKAKRKEKKTRLTADDFGGLQEAWLYIADGMSHMLVLPLDRRDLLSTSSSTKAGVFARPFRVDSPDSVLLSPVCHVCVVSVRASNVKKTVTLVIIF